MRRHTAVLAALVLTLSACGDSGGEPAARKPAAPLLTMNQAQEVLAKYQSVNNQANKALDDRLLASAETGAQLDMDTAAYKLRRATKQRLAEFTYTKPSYYIPRLRTYPRWFAVAATSRETGTGNRRDTGRRAAYGREHALLFLQDSATAPWRLAADPYPTTKRIEGIAIDREGYAAAVPPDDAQVALAPSKIAVAHAALLTNGPKTPAAAGLGAGPHTNQAYDALRRATAQFSKLGVNLTSQFTPGTAGSYALRTTDGGALVWYVLQQKEKYTSKKAGAISVTGDLVGLTNAVKVKDRLDTTVLVQYLAKVPPKNKGAVEVTGTYRTAVQAAAS